MLGLAGFEPSGLCHAICRAMQSQGKKTVPNEFSRLLTATFGQIEFMAGLSMDKILGETFNMSSNRAYSAEI